MRPERAGGLTGARVRTAPVSHARHTAGRRQSGIGIARGSDGRWPRSQLSSSRRSSWPLHVVPNRDNTAPVCLHFKQMQGDVPVESLEEGDAVADHDGHDGVAKLVSQPAAQAFARDRTTTDKPDAAEI